MLPLTQPTAEFSVSQTWHWLASSLPGSLLFTPAPPHPRFSPSTAASQPLRGSRCFQACLKLSSRHGEGHRWVRGSRLGTFASLLCLHSCHQIHQGNSAPCLSGQPACSPLGMEARRQGKIWEAHLSYVGWVGLFHLPPGDPSFGLQEASGKAAPIFEVPRR